MSTVSVETYWEERSARALAEQRLEIAVKALRKFSTGDLGVDPTPTMDGEWTWRQWVGHFVAARRFVQDRALQALVEIKHERAQGPLAGAPTERQ